METLYTIKSREAKDKHICSNFKNTLAWFHFDIINYGPDIAFRKLLMFMISLQIAKNVE